MPNDNVPANEGPKNAIDGDPNSKYLHFDGASRATGFRVITADPTVVEAIRLTSANDAPERDPASFTLEGSTDGRDWTEIASGSIDPFPSRHAVWATGFDNDEAFTHYQVLFPALQNQGSANSMQIAEVELMGRPAAND